MALAIDIEILTPQTLTPGGGMKFSGFRKVFQWASNQLAMAAAISERNKKQIEAAPQNLHFESVSTRLGDSMWILEVMPIVTPQMRRTFLDN